MHVGTDCKDPGDLIARAKSGDRQAIAELLDRHSPYLRGVILRESSDKLKEWVQPEDLLQVIYLKIFLNIGTFQTGGDDGFRAWSATVARHTVQDAGRAINRRLEVRPAFADPDQSYRSVAEEALADSRSPTRNLAVKELRAEIDKALARMPNDNRRAIELYDLDGRTFQEAANEMRCSLSKTFRARQEGLEYLRHFLT